jgi:hypothetical protein
LAIRLDRVEKEEEVVAGARCQRRGVEGEVSEAGLYQGRNFGSNFSVRATSSPISEMDAYK